MEDLMLPKDLIIKFWCFSLKLYIVSANILNSFWNKFLKLSISFINILSILIYFLCQNQDLNFILDIFSLNLQEKITLSQLDIY